MPSLPKWPPESTDTMLNAAVFLDLSISGALPHFGKTRGRIDEALTKDQPSLYPQTSSFSGCVHDRPPHTPSLPTGPRCARPKQVTSNPRRHAASCLSRRPSL